jgi:hypothetical protein
VPSLRLRGFRMERLARPYGPLLLVQTGTVIHLFSYPPLFTDVALSLSLGFVVVRLGHKVLGLLREVDRYRAERRSRRRV